MPSVVLPRSEKEWEDDDCELPLALAEFASPVVANDGNERNSSTEVNEMAETEAVAAGADTVLALLGDTVDADANDGAGEDNEEVRADFRFTDSFVPAEVSAAL